jgi:uncharacterized membrane protein
MTARGFRRLGFWTMAVLSVLIAVASYRYLLPGAPGAAPPVFANRFTHLGALTLHAGLAATALILGPWQFLGRLRRNRPRFHRRLGTLYVCCCLIAAPAGMVLALGTTAGPLASAGFGLLAIVWLTVTANAWRLARRREFAAHQRWMMRSFALTLAAVTLRLYLPISVVMGFTYAQAYPVISFLAWVPNLIIIEIAIRLGAGAKTSLSLSEPLHNPG